MRSNGRGLFAHGFGLRGCWMMPHKKDQIPTIKLQGRFKIQLRFIAICLFCRFHHPISAGASLCKEHRKRDVDSRRRASKRHFDSTA